MATNTVYTESQIKEYVDPLVKNIQKLISSDRTVIIGVAGGLGCGKSTLSSFVMDRLRTGGHSAENFSIDDFITSYEDRQKMAAEHQGNPFYQIYRAMPGTHRVDDLYKVLEEVKDGRDFELPIFDKSLREGWGDISPETKKVTGRQDVVIFEGWLVGTPYVSSERFIGACERNGVDLRAIDPKLEHHKMLLSEIRNYQKLWGFLDYLVMLKAESNELHHKWRYEAEITKAKENARPEKEVHKYVDIFMPLIIAGYEFARPDVTITLDKNHKFSKIARNQD